MTIVIAKKVFSISKIFVKTFLSKLISLLKNYSFFLQFGHLFGKTLSYFETIEMPVVLVMQKNK
jgi:hypothetical protein